MSLQQHLWLNTPVIWCQTEDLHEVEEVCIKGHRKNLYMIHPFDEFCKWDKDRNEWRTVLMKYPNGEYGACSDMGMVLDYMHQGDNAGILIVYTPSELAEKLANLLVFSNRDYQHSMATNNADNLPPQFVFASVGNQVPDELVGFCTSTSVGPPETVEIADMFVEYMSQDSSIISATNGEEEINLKPHVQSVLGLSRVRIREGVNLSIVNNGIIDVGFLEEYKKSYIKRNTTLEIVKPNISFNEIGGLDKLKQVIESSAYAWHNPEETAKWDIKAPRKLLMVGVPGTGKSAICKATAQTLQMDLVKFGVSQMVNKFIGQSEANMRNAFKQLAALAPVVAWIDELGRDLSGSGSSNDAGTTDRVHAEFLTGLQELPDEIFVLGAANNISGLPPEMLRAGRFDLIMFVGFPAFEERMQIFNIMLKDKAQNIDIEALAEKTPLWTGSEIENLISETKFRVGFGEKRQINTDDILVNTSRIKNRIWIQHRPKMIEMYRDAIDRFEWASNAQRKDAEQIVSLKRAQKQPVSSASF